MPNRFDLIITADTTSHTAEFCLCDAAGVQLAYQKTVFHDLSASQQRGLFDLRDHLRLYVEAGREQATVATVGVCIAEKVLGKDIFTRLWQSQTVSHFRHHADALAQRGVQVDGLADVHRIRAHFDGERNFANHGADMGADDATAQYLAVAVGLGGIIEQQLGEAFVATVGNGAARGRPVEQALLDLDALA
jgi:hypothetical protein